MFKTEQIEFTECNGALVVDSRTRGPNSTGFDSPLGLKVES